MEKTTFRKALEKASATIEAIRDAAHRLHAGVNQTYDGTLPYGYHLSMVAEAAMAYGHEVVDDEADIVPLVFGAYFHDSIEDARLTYNDVKKRALDFTDERGATTAAEIVYALTNDKGRTRAERAGEHYYAGIRQTPYAPFVKLCDRYANMKHSAPAANAGNSRMREVYRREWPHFIEAVTAPAGDARLGLPAALRQAVEQFL